MPTASERTWPSDAQRKKDAGRTAGELRATKTRKVTESERKETTSDLPASSHEFRTSNIRACKVRQTGSESRKCGIAAT